jgi:hypothetical protein
MEDFHARIIEEQKELQIKIDALENSEIKIENLEQNILLKNQLIAMRSYNEALILRLALLKK